MMTGFGRADAGVNANKQHAYAGCNAIAEWLERAKSARQTPMLARRSLGGGVSADAGDETPFDRLAIPHILRIAAERLLFVQRSDDERCVAGEQHGGIPARWMRREKRNVRQ